MIISKQIRRVFQSAGPADRLLTKMRIAFASVAQREALVDGFYQRWEDSATAELDAENKDLRMAGTDAVLIDQRTRGFKNAIVKARLHKESILGIGSPRPS